MINRLFLSFGLMLACLPVFSQIPDACRLQFGTNISGPSDWGSEWPFVNIMKYSRQWITHNDQWVGGGQNLWDTDMLEFIPVDAAGYPLSLPVAVPGAESPQIVRTVWANTDALPEGNYVVLYDGTGDLDVWGDAAVLSEIPGRLEFQLTHGNDIFALELRSSMAGDHVRNIRVLLPGTESTYAGNPWSEQWLQQLDMFRVVRFMDWGYTNGSTMRNWQDRTQVADYTWTRKNGVPYEFWAALCNLKDADAWICVPHAASDDYVVQMATFFRDNLEPERKVYVEYSNETWNWIFDQAHYGVDSLDQNLPWPERLGPRIAHVMDLWTGVFAGQENRLVRVLASQHAWWDLVQRTYAQIESDGQSHLIDAISPAAYMGLDGDVVQTWTASTTGAEVLSHAQDFTFDPAEYAMQGWHAFAALAREKGKKLVFYEGGQHFTPQPFGVEQPYCPALVECQTLPGMYTLYNELFDTLRTLSDSQMVFMNFSFLAPLNCRYGSWGLLTSQFAFDTSYADAPKYRALRDEIVAYNDCQSISSTTGAATPFDVQVFPNPTRDRIFMQMAAGAEGGTGRIALCDLSGRVLKTGDCQAGETLRLDLYGLASGVYTLSVQHSGGTECFRVIKIE